MDLPIEVWTIVLSYLHLNDLIEMSATCKFFYYLSRENKLFIKKMNESNRLFNDKGKFFDHYYDMCFSFSSLLTVCLREHVCMKNLIEAKSIVLDKLFHAILPFRVWKHLFLCVRSHNEKDMCAFRTKIYINNKKISQHINKKLFVEIDKYIPMELQFGVAAAKDINLFVHTNVCDKKHAFDRYTNFGIVFYESMNSPFIIWKLYLDILCRVVFNLRDKSVLHVILSGATGDCRRYTACASKNCSNMKLNKIKAIFFREILCFCKRLAAISSLSVNLQFINYVFITYKRDEDFFTEFIEIEKYE